MLDASILDFVLSTGRLSLIARSDGLGLDQDSPTAEVIIVILHHLRLDNQVEVAGMVILEFLADLHNSEFVEDAVDQGRVLYAGQEFRAFMTEEVSDAIGIGVNQALEYAIVNDATNSRGRELAETFGTCLLFALTDIGFPVVAAVVGCWSWMTNLLGPRFARQIVRRDAVLSIGDRSVDMLLLDNRDNDVAREARHLG